MFVTHAFVMYHNYMHIEIHPLQHKNIQATNTSVKIVYKLIEINLLFTV